MLSAALCFAADPTPQQVIKVQDEEVPVYAPGQVQPLRTGNPEYPAAYRARSVEGHAILVIMVGPDGEITGSEVKESTPGKELGEAAQASLKKWRFPKMTWKGRPGRYVVTVPFVFSVR